MADLSDKEEISTCSSLVKVAFNISPTKINASQPSSVL